MKINNDTYIDVISNDTGEILQSGDLDQFINPTDIVIDNEIEAIMEDPVNIGKSLLSDLDKHYIGYSYGPKISIICLYLAVCCCIDKTDICKSLISSLANVCYITLDYPHNDIKYEQPEEVRYLLKEIVKRMIDEHRDLFEYIARRVLASY